MKRILALFFIILNLNLSSEEYEIYCENKGMSPEVSYKKDKKNKVWIEYYKTGKIKTKGYCKDGKKDGEWTEYYENGNLKSIGTYKDNEKEGTWIFYRENGKLKKVRRYTKGYLVDPRFSD